MKTLGAFFGVITLAAAGSAFAAPVSSSGPYTVSGDGLDAFDCTSPTWLLWEQPPDGANGLSSQDDTCYPFQSECADDFIGDGRGAVGSVGWYGVYWNGTPLAPDAFNVRFYSDASGLPGTELSLTTSSIYNETAGDPYAYCSDVDGFPTTWGVKYHVSIQAVVCFPPQWGISTGTGNGVEGSFKSALFGFPNWTPNSAIFGGLYELAFLLFAAETGTPTEEASWSAIKNFYR